MGRQSQSKARQLEALLLQRDGKSLKDIAESLGVSYDKASKIIKAALDRLEKYAVEDKVMLRRIEALRLDDLLEAWTPYARGGLNLAGLVLGPNDKAASIVLQASARRAALFGLDAPKQHDIDVNYNVAQSPVTIDVTNLTIEEQEYLLYLVDKAQGKNPAKVIDALPLISDKIE